MASSPRARRSATSRLLRLVPVSVALAVVAGGFAAGLPQAMGAPSPGTAYAAGDPITPWASYTFEGDSGSTVVDQTGQGHNATWHGTSSYSSVGGNGTAAYVSSTGSSPANYLTIPRVTGASDGSNSFSFEFWLDETSNTSDAAIFSNQNFTHCYNPGTTFYNTAANTGLYRECFGQNGTSTTQHYMATITNSNAQNQWHYVAGVYNRTAGTISYYVDGVLSSTASPNPDTSLTSAFNLNSGYNFALGSPGTNGAGAAPTDTGDGYLNGYFDDVNFYSAAISPAQIAADYDATGGNVAIPVTVTNDGNGSASASPASATPGSTVNLTATPNTGYHLAGWQTSTPGVTISGNGFTMPAAVTSVKATFAPNSYAVHFDPNGGTGTMTDEALTYGQAATLTPNAFSNGGAAFIGWSTTPTGAVTYSDQQSVQNLSSTNGSSVTLYAQWAPAGSFQVTETGDAHVKATASSDSTAGWVLPGTTVDLTATPTPGYHSSWNVVSPSGLVLGSDGSFTMPSSNVDVQAISAPNSYAVNFNANGGSGSMPSLTMAYDQPTTLPANGFTNTGATVGTFLGWATTPNGKPVYTDQQSVQNLTTTNNGTVTLYAEWQHFRAAGDTVAPVVSYSFDSDSGRSVTDSSGYGNAGTWTGSKGYAPGISGLAAHVTNGTNYIQLPEVAGVTDGSGSFSFSTWVGEYGETQDAPIISNGNYSSCTNAGLNLFNVLSTTTQGLCWGTTVGGTKVKPTVSSTALQGSWHYLSVVVDRSAQTVSYYLDGSLAYTSTAGQVTASTSFNSGYPFTLGQDGPGNYYLTTAGDATIDALFDDFDFYGQAIGASQIANDYNATKPTSTTLPTETVITNSTGTTLSQGFVTDTFHAPEVKVGAAVSQPLGELWNGGTVVSYTKLSGDSWLNVNATTGVVTGTAPSSLPQHPGTITVQASDGTTTSNITLEVPVIAAGDAPQIESATWNLWDAGTEVNSSFLKDLAIIADNGLDLIGVQQDGGTVAKQLATALGWYYYEGAGNGLGIVSAWPISTSGQVTDSATAPGMAATVTIDGQPVRVWVVGLSSSGYGPENVCLSGVTDPSTIATDEKASSRYTQAQLVTNEIAADVQGANPVIVLGDLESPSAADWTSAAASSHCGVGPVDWPVPDLFTGVGLTDSFRKANPDPVAAPGNTWSPVVPVNAASGAPEPQDRIDYVDYAGSGLAVDSSSTLVAGWPSASSISTNMWTSNHAAVVTQFTLGTSTSTAPPVAPTLTVANQTLSYAIGNGPASSAALLAAIKASSSAAGAVIAVDQSAVNYNVYGAYTAMVTATDPSTGYVSDPVPVTINVVPVGDSTAVAVDATGTITDGSGHPASGVCVYLYTSPSASLASYASCTKSDGTFDIPNVPQGSYTVAVADPAGHFATWWSSSPMTVDGATPITVALSTVGTGTVAGTLTDGTNPLSGECVYLYPQGDSTGASYATCTGADGTYYLSGVQAGTYEVAYYDPTGAYPTAWWTGTAGGASSQAGATPIVVNGGVTSTANAALTKGTSEAVSGTISTTSGPAADVCVYLYAGPSGNAAYATCTGADGSYWIGGIDSSQSYRMVVSDPSGALATQWWTGSAGGAGSYAGATPLAADPGGTVTANLTLAAVVKGGISGTVTANGSPAADVCVYLYQAGRSDAASYATCTAADGTFALSGVVSGSYQVAYFDPTGALATQWWTGSAGGAATQGGATTVTISGGPEAGVDAAMTSAS